MLCISFLVHFYRPQRSWAKVIFSQACVKNSVHRRGVCLSACWDTTPPDQADTPPDQADTTPRPGRSPPGKQTPAYGLRAAGTHPTGMHSCLLQEQFQRYNDGCLCTKCAHPDLHLFSIDSTDFR